MAIKVKPMDLDKMLLNKYRNLVLSRMATIGNINLSKELTRIIGYSADSDPLRGFFYKDTHSIDIKDSDRTRAIDKLSNIIKLDEKEIDFSNYNANKNSFRDENLTLHKKNFTSCFKSSVNCKGPKGGNCKNKWTISYNNYIEQGDDGYLYLPEKCLNGKTDFILNEIIRHFFCDHTANNSRSADIFLYGRNVGPSVECLYVLCLVATDNKGKSWDFESGKPKLPLADEYESRRLIRYCDYIVLVPNDTTYWAINFAARYNNANFEFKTIIQEPKIVVRFTTKQLYVSCNSTRQIVIELDGVKMVVPTEKIHNSCHAPIIHLLVFDNHQKITEKTGSKQPLDRGGD